MCVCVCVCRQAVLFRDLGSAMLEAAWQGINCSLLAYGQTGSGKVCVCVCVGACTVRRSHWVPLHDHHSVPLSPLPPYLRRPL